MCASAIGYGALSRIPSWSHQVHLPGVVPPCRTRGGVADQVRDVVRSQDQVWDVVRSQNQVQDGVLSPDEVPDEVADSVRNHVRRMTSWPRFRT